MLEHGKGKKETIYPLVQTVNALYLQLLEIQQAFTSTDATPNTLPTLEDIKDLQTEYTNMLTAIIDLLDGAKYLWVQIAIQNGHLCHVRRSVCDIIGGQPKTN